MSSLTLMDEEEYYHCPEGHELEGFLPPIPGFSRPDPAGRIPDSLQRYLKDPTKKEDLEKPAEDIIDYPDDAKLEQK